MIDTLKRFTNDNLFSATSALLEKLHIQFDRETAEPMSIADFWDGPMPQYLKDAQECIDSTYFIGIVNDGSLQGNKAAESLDSIAETMEHGGKYDGMFVFAVDAKVDANLTRTVTSALTRAFNRIASANPVILFIRQGNKLSISTCERMEYSQAWRQGSGEKLGKVNILQHINCNHPHRAHLDILKGLKADDCNTFEQIYKLWMSQFDISALNLQFYTELQTWFYWTVSKIELPDYNNTSLKKEQVNKNFVVRMLSRMMFCWFLKEKTDKSGNAVIDSRLLDLKDYTTDEYYPIVNNLGKETFLNSSSYYRGVLQNVFFCGLNSNTKKSKKDFKCQRYLPEDFDFSIFIRIPFLNGSTFRPLDDDFFKDSIEEDAMRIPNALFYGDGEHRGINEIFHDYKFTVEENTPSDVDIALDPEMLGMVFENLLAEIDPQNDEGTAKSIRKATGSFYTPRPVIQEMTNESLSHYLYKNIRGENDSESDVKHYLSELVYKDRKETDKYDRKVVNALYKIRVLDPACGSGAFPMGVLQRIVDILRIVDPKSETWLQLMLEPIEDPTVREQFRRQLSGSTSDYQRKLGIIRNCIYAIDIQPIAVQITKLRFFISLLADQEIDTSLPNSGILPFPNMETKIVCADSLKNLQANFFVEQTKKELITARQKYYQPNITPAEREKIADEIADIMDQTFSTFAVQIGLKQVSNKAALKHWFIDANISAPFFDMGTFFPEIKEGFDIVIGNPPYGGFKIVQEVRDALALGSNDPYGAFIARFLGNGSRITPLKDGGMLAFIVSDTFMTIGTHLALRRQMMHSRIHKMIRMNPKTFSATVNTVTIFCEKRKDIRRKDEHGTERPYLDIEGTVCTMADMTNIDIHEDFSHFVEVLSLSMNMDSDECIANEEYAIYRYPQTIIQNCSNLPFFVASPKLFVLMQDENLLPGQKKNIEINGNLVGYRNISLNDFEVSLYKLGDISEVKQGLATGDNKAYFYQNPDVRGSYRNIHDYAEYVITEDDLNKIHQDDKLRLTIIQKGFSKTDKNSERYFGGRYIVRFDKGGESDADGGWMPNYYVPSDFYMDWSEWAVNRLNNFTIADRIRLYKENKRINSKSENQKAAVIRSPQTYFQAGLTLSHTGVYSPTFRLNNPGPYNCAGSNLFSEVDIFYLLGILNSKMKYYLFKNCINHSVNASEDPVKEIPIPKGTEVIANIIAQVNNIIEHQKLDRYYDYASHEQLEIDKLVYEAYGLNDDDIKEVETWYARRYPKLAAAQRKNLEKVRQEA